MEIFEDYAMYQGKRISLYEAACILARAMQPMIAELYKEDGYEHYELAMALKYNAIDAWVHGEEKEDA